MGRTSANEPSPNSHHPMQEVDRGTGKILIDPDGR